MLSLLLIFEDMHLLLAVLLPSLITDAALDVHLFALCLESFSTLAATVPEDVRSMQWRRKPLRSL